MGLIGMTTRISLCGWHFVFRIVAAPTPRIFSVYLWGPVSPKCRMQNAECRILVDFREAKIFFLPTIVLYSVTVGTGALFVQFFI